jgi:hypothetical protein
MKLYSPIRTDLVIGMTLAELFLLILFVVWYSHGPGAGKDWKHIAAEQQHEIEMLSSQLASDQARIAKLETIENFWRRNFGVSPPTTVQQVTDTLKSTQGESIRIELLRGYPRCDQDDNTLVEAALQNGQTELRIRQPIGSVSLKEWADSAGVRLPSAGAVLSGDLAANNFLSTLQRYYSHTKAVSKPCRFDYRLRWTTDTDYRMGRETLERYLYPAGLIGSAENGQ